MEQEDITFYLSVFSAILSTILGILKLIDNRKKNRRRFIVNAEISEPFNSLNINLINKGVRPISIKQVQLIYGNEFGKQLVLEQNHINGIEILESRNKVITISRKDIITHRQKNDIKQKYSCFLWVKAFLQTGEYIHSKIEISRSIITGEVYKYAIEYVKADLILGFEQLESKFEYISGSSAFSKGGR